jgi:hypothetical protein
MSHRDVRLEPASDIVELHRLRQCCLHTRIDGILVLSGEESHDDVRDASFGIDNQRLIENLHAGSASRNFQFLGFRWLSLE